MVNKEYNLKHLVSVELVNSYETARWEYRQGKRGLFGLCAEKSGYYRMPFGNNPVDVSVVEETGEYIVKEDNTVWRKSHCVLKFSDRSCVVKNFNEVPHAYDFYNRIKNVCQTSNLDIK